MKHFVFTSIVISFFSFASLHCTPDCSGCQGQVKSQFLVQSNFFRTSTHYKMRFVTEYGSAECSNSEKVNGNHPSLFKCKIPGQEELATLFIRYLYFELEAPYLIREFEADVERVEDGEYLRVVVSPNIVYRARDASGVAIELDACPPPCPTSFADVNLTTPTPPSP